MLMVEVLGYCVTWFSGLCVSRKYCSRQARAVRTCYHEWRRISSVLAAIPAYGGGRLREPEVLSDLILKVWQERSSFLESRASSRRPRFSGRIYGSADRSASTYHGFVNVKELIGRILTHVADRACWLSIEHLHSKQIHRPRSSCTI